MNETTDTVAVSIYDPMTGRIIGTPRLPPKGLETYINDNVTMIFETGDPLTQWVSGGELLDRPANPAILAGTLLNGLPQPCAIAINGTVYQCADDHADLSLPPGEYRITVSAWPYLDANFTLRV